MSVFYTKFDGICFVEESPPKARPIRKVDIQVGGIFTSGQLKNLDYIKRLMAAEAKNSGGNAVIAFKYGQRSVGFFASLLNRDDVVWYGSGMIAVVGERDLS